MIALNCRTEFSFLRGFGGADAWQSRVEEMDGFMVVADYCSTWGHPHFDKAGLGVQLPIVPRLEKDGAHDLVTVIPLSQDGLEAMYELVSLAYQQSYYRPRITWDQLAKHMKDEGTFIVDALSPSRFEYYDKIGFGFIGVAPTASSLLHAAEDCQAVIAPGPRYPRPEDRVVFEALQGIGNRRGEHAINGVHLLGRPEIDALLQRLGVDVKGRWWGIAEEMAAELREQNIRPPQGKLVRPDHLPSFDEMVTAKLRRPEIEALWNDEYQARLDREMELIREKGFEDYFRFVSDLVDHARRSMLVGPGRGSAGGSLLCFVLGITNVDPMVHGTMFERFIDPGRSDLPDIDVDFPDHSRDRVFGYLRDTYGEQNVGRIGTVARFGAKGAINDAARTGGVPGDVSRALGKLAEDADIPLSILFGENDDAKKVVETHPQLEVAARLEGHVRHHGMHAAGVVVAGEPVTKYAPVDKNGVMSVDLDAAEGQGLLKFDALGLRTLAVIQDACDLLGINPYDDIDWTLLDDPDVYRIFAEDRVTGIFQFEGYAVRELMKRMTVTEFADLCALASLARPGPLYSGQADDWIKRRCGEADVEYIHPALEAATGETYGVIVYQEQAMAVVRELAGFDAVEVNLFRRAVGKKVPEKLQAMKERFLEGCAEKGLVGAEQAEQIWHMLEEYSGYAFNKSHAVAYSMITYASAWLKAHHPLQFVCAQLRGMDDEQKTKNLLRELRAEGFDFVPFDIDRSRQTWDIIDGKVYGGFTAVRGVGRKTADTLVSMREADPDTWKERLTDAQKRKLLTLFNTPWHDLDRLQTLYADYYAEDHPKTKRRVWLIDEMPQKKGTYNFIGTLRRVDKRQKTDSDGKVIGHFINLYFEDDSGDVGCTINRFKFAKFQWLLEEAVVGHDFLVRGEIINDGRQWLFVDNLKELECEK